MKRTNLLRKNNARAYLNYLRAIGIPFEMTCSNYMVTFKAGKIDKKFVHNMQSNRAFAGFAKLKKDVKTKPIPEIDREKLSYFVHGFKHPCEIGDVINIDLKAAYATVLYNDGYISRDTFDYISRGTKQERLVSVGMLASRKQKFTFDTGKIIANEEIISEYSNFFFHAVKRTSEIMGDLKTICGNKHLFTWVDGLYLLPYEREVEQCKKYIDNIGFGYSIDYLRDFKVAIDRKQVTVHFLKSNSRGEWKPKPFNLPLQNSEIKRIMIDALLKVKSRKNESHSLPKPRSDRPGPFRSRAA